MSTALRVLVIDDDEMIRTGYVLLLSRQGYEVFEAATGARGLELVAGMNPDIILLDVVLPDMDGFAVCKLILEQNSENEPMVIMISGLRTGLDSKVQGFESGALDFYMKPVPTSELLARLGSMAGIRDTRRKLRQQITEKDQLMRKLHHRIKTDLMLVESIIDIRQHELSDSGSLAVFKDLRNRVDSIIAIHECLYRSGDLESVAVGTYFNELKTNMYRFLAGHSDSITLVVETQDCALDVDHAMAFGMIATELVSNAIKHAFPGGRQGTIRLALVRRDALLDLIVEDDGCGFPDGFDLDSASALGLVLVKAIVATHDGTMTFRTSNPTRFHLSFPFKQEVPRAC